MASYADVETALARMHGASPEAQRGAFRGRIKHLQRLGLPLGEKPGKGKRIDYSDEQIWQIALSLELSECGIDPTTVVQLVTIYWDLMFKKNFESQISSRSYSSSLLVISIALMSSSWAPIGDSMIGIQAIGWVEKTALAENMTSKSHRRVIVIDTWRMLNELSKQLDQLKE